MSFLDLNRRSLEQVLLSRLSSKEVKNWLERTEQITIEDIKSALPEQDYDTLTLGQEQNGIRCLTIAKLRTKADIQSTGHIYDEALPEVRLALMKMFIYELFLC